jgi:hypothetical protein
VGASDVLAVLALVVSVLSAVFSYQQTRSLREQVRIEQQRHARETEPEFELAFVDWTNRVLLRQPEGSVVVKVRFVGPQPTLKSVEFRAQQYVATLSWLVRLKRASADPADRIRWGPVNIGDSDNFVVHPAGLGGLPKDVVLIAECAGPDGARWTRLLRVPTSA